MVNHRRGPWTHNEDALLRRLVQLNGPHNWVRISHDIRSRSPKQCRERYHQNLKPNLNHNPITPEEGEAIVRMVAEMGKKWAEIARRLNGRSDNAVKNWWNGCQHRRKRDPVRPDSRRQEQAHAPQSAYHYSTVPRHSPVHSAQTVLPPIRDFSEPSFYSLSRRPSLNPPSTSPHSVKLPDIRGYDAYPGSRPQPLQLPPYQYNPRAQGYETPMPSPGYSIASVDAPSLVTDTGSESRSPRGALSPLDHSRASTIGSREERRNSTTRYLPASGFATDDDHHSHWAQYRRRSSIQLAPLNLKASASASRGHDYRPEHQYGAVKSQLLTQPAHGLVHRPSSQVSPLLPSPAQLSLPSYRGLSLPQTQAASPSSVSLSSRQLPSLSVQVGELRSSPSSPRKESPRDNRMRIDNIM